MARIASVNLPKEKRIEIALTYIYGIGKTLSLNVLETTKIDKNKKVKDLSEDEIQLLREQIVKFQTEGDLRRKVTMDVKRLKDINCYRGVRHKKSLPCRGQQTKTNSRTKKGKKKTVANKKIATK
jgi:small subunit ribosomal protein S13